MKHLNRISSQALLIGMTLLLSMQLSRAFDSTKVDVRNITAFVHYVGVGNSAEDPFYSITALYPGETEDPAPTHIAFGDSVTNDSMEITVLSRVHTSGDRRVVMIDNYTGNPLANVEFTRMPGSGNYRLNGPTGNDSVFHSPDSTVQDELKWGVVTGYLNSAEYVKVGQAEIQSSCPCEGQGSACQAFFPHDNICTGFGDGGSGPFNINRVRVYAPCYGTTWVNLLSCCQAHDRNLWCANASTGVLGVTLANVAFFGCVASRIASHVASKVPWYCGGQLVGGLVGAAQGIIVGGIAYAVVTAITSVQLITEIGDHCYLYAGNDQNSCLCGGDTPTYKCGGELMCEGVVPDFVLNGGDNPICFCQPGTFQFDITPKVAGATYTWSTTGSVSYTVTGEGTADVSATGQGTVTVTVQVPGCPNYTKTITREVFLGAPPAPVIEVYEGGVPPCIKRRPGTLFINKEWIQNPSCPIEYKITGISNIGGSVVAATGGQQWHENSYWITARPNFEGQQFCFSMKARNQCGESPETIFCIDVDDDCTYEQSLKAITVDGYNDFESVQLNERADLIRVFPNPTEGLLQVELLSESANLHLELRDFAGRVVKETNLSGASLNWSLSDVAPGIYLIRASDQQSEQLIKVVIR